LAIVQAVNGVQVANSDRGAEPTTNPDPPPRRTIPRVGPDNHAPSWDLDGTYLWLGPSGAASFASSGGDTSAEWDSTFGADAAVIRIRERRPLAAIGGTLGVSRWSARDGGRVWLDALAGTRLAGRMIGLSAGPIVELAQLAHPRIGGSIGVWAFFGIVPFARIGTVHELGMFGEVGIHIALPVLKRR
jgi:hypothetical protein